MGPYFRRWHRESRPCWEPGATPVFGRGLEGGGVVVKGHPAPKGAALNPGGGGGGSCGSPTVQLWDRSQCHPDRRCSPPPSPPPSPQIPGSSCAQMWQRSQEPAVRRWSGDAGIQPCPDVEAIPGPSCVPGVTATLRSSCAQMWQRRPPPQDPAVCSCDGDVGIQLCTAVAESHSVPPPLPLSLCLSVCPSIPLPIHLSVFCVPLSLRPSVPLSSVPMTVPRPSVSLSLCPPVPLSFHP